MTNGDTALPEAEFYEGRDLEAVADLDNYYSWVLADLLPLLKGKTIEVGAGIGTVAARYVDRVEHAWLLEPARNLGPRLRQRFAGHPKVTVLERMLEEVTAAISPASERLVAGTFDAAIMVNVLEHIDDDGAVLRGLFDLLRPGAHLLLFVPANQWLYGSLDALLGHVRRYSRSGLEEVVERAGFAIEQLHFMDALGMLPWFVAGRVLRHRHVSPMGAAAYDRFGVPVARLLERFVTPPVGKSLVCIARR